MRRVVITGLGVVAPNGIGKDAFWNACINGKSGVRHITQFDASPLTAQIAGEVPDFDPLALGLTHDEIRKVDRATQFAIAASNLALKDAELEAMSEAERDRTGVYMGAAMASIAEGERLWARLTGRGIYPARENEENSGEIMVSHHMTHMVATGIAVHQHVHGPINVVATGCSAGGDAVGQAYWNIQDGRADIMLAGGADSSITYGGMNAFCVLGAVSTRNDDPTRASRPYDRDRDGFVMAEGAGILVLEELEHALARGAHIYAEMIAFVSNSNAHHMTSLPPNGEPLQLLLRKAMKEADITPKQINYINSHGSSTPPNEIAETAAYKAVFGEQAYRIPISGTKSMIGHTQGGASAIEAVVTALTIDNQLMHPTINQENPDPQCDLDYVPNVARPGNIEIAISHSSGFGGVNTALVLARPDWYGR